MRLDCISTRKGEVVLVSRLRAALELLNPALQPEAITAAVDELARDLLLPRLLLGQVTPASAKQIVQDAEWKR